MIEKRVISNKEKLVIVTETVLQSQVIGYTGATNRDEKEETDDSAG